MPVDPVQQQVLYDELSSHISRHFHHPDLEALRVVFAVVHAHYSEGDPVWLFVIGPSGSGKTSIALNCISELPDVTIESELTPRSFLAGKAAKSSATLLNRNSLIIGFKDFTTMISKREESQREIVASMREIYDGSLKYRTAEAVRSWNGKATVIAAVTPAIERAWSIHRDLGERFSQVRWQNTRVPTQASKMARAQLGHEREISQQMRLLTKTIFATALDGPAYLPEHYGDRIDAAAAAVAQLRRQVIRDSSAGRPIIELGSAEEPTRLGKTLVTIATHHAALFGREEVTAIDIKAAMRTALDTVPSSRLGIVTNIPGTIAITQREIREMSGLHKNTITWQAEELTALGVLSENKKMEENTNAYTPEFSDLWDAAGFNS